MRDYRSKRQYSYEIQTTATTNAEDAAFNFFPNPASEEVTLDLNQLVDKDVTLTVYNALGQVVEVLNLGLV